MLEARGAGVGLVVLAGALAMLSCAASEAAPGGRTKHPSTASGKVPCTRADAGKLNKGEVAAVLMGAGPDLDRCSELDVGIVSGEIEIACDGSVAWVAVKPPYGGEPVGECVAGVLRGLRFPVNDGRTGPITYPVHLK